FLPIIAGVAAKVFPKIFCAISKKC
uniref:Brevinin-1Pa n=2 Tax=Lithobates pipiens TaxID=8404 RepID=BR1A_LITPI|nr:RecName: Full=Brevinin-1Pa [Lithobates pipiens]